MAGLDHTHDPGLRSWVPGADGHADFPIQNLAFGVVAPSGEGPRAGVAIGAFVLDLPGALAAGLVEGEAGRAVAAMREPALNGFLALGAGPRRALRLRLVELLREGAPERGAVEPLLHPAASCTPHLPARIGDYTDFYAGLHHATSVGRLFRPDEPLLANYKHVPIGYHGRASSVIPSGQPVRRPNGQTKPRDATAPLFGPSRRLDYELELGIWIGPGNALGEPIPIGRAGEHVAGFCLLNDWSARDVQAWEYQPLGPFLAKSFATTLSPWIVTPEALAPFRTAPAPRPEGDPQPLPYLDDPRDREEGALAIDLDVVLTTPALRERGLPPHRLARSDARHLYWTAAQLVAHHASGGCNLRPGDLFGTGTISGPDRAQAGSLLEATEGGRIPIRLDTGEERRFLEDGDEVILSARCRREGFAPIGFGECRAVILPAL
ncbi:fumarylacetoacetase [Methylobacterium isbiliense]|jgi:fumarylacetoacetase|uniref:fumarylacetoacetase n=1 Tax=Methylobacterium isbiliense TaxID=315478 RepID=A0ABQ4S5T2_9HYPH|nr:fumarylacetoacetase [Methylobacterium isbiliense]MDN3623240.1 fumarylacetoacetase [Methylobacterium isbiliense]GJD98311.1 hypothetical protein GMJLKIPL_0218 [Methylobacterium isbiliense]